MLPPSSGEELDQTYMRARDAIMNNLPHPVPRFLCCCPRSPDTNEPSCGRKCRDSCSYIPVSDMLRHVGAMSYILPRRAAASPEVVVEPMGNLATPLPKSPVIREAYQAAANDARNRGLRRFSFIHVVCWDDDAEINNTKSNRTSAHIKTVTIYGFDDLPPQLLTFPVFVAPKGASRVVQRAEQLFQEEMRLLKKTGHFTIFDGRCHVRGTVPVCVHSVAALQDQPMRRGSNHLMLGTSNLHVRFGYSGHVKALQRFLPACRTCIRKRRQPTVASDEGRAHGDDQCSNCLSWRFPEVDEMLNRFPPPPDYPSDAEDLYTVSNSEQVFILPKKITHELLVARTRTARTNLESGHWDIKSASAYLARLGVTDSTISDLLLPAHRRRMLAFYTAREGSRLTPSQARTAASIQLALQEHPESFEDVPDPPAWKGVHTLWQFIDVIMHLLFLGIIKHLVFDMHEGFKMASSLPAFIERTARRLKSIPSLSWLVKEDYLSAGLSGWVSENFVALARLFPWIFQDCGDCIAKEAGSARGERQATALLGNPTNWTKDQLLTWLHTRAIDIQAFADMPDISGECSKVQEHCRAYSLLRVPMVELKKSQLVAMVQHIQRIPPIRGDEEEWTIQGRPRAFRTLFWLEF